ncbi:glycosyltransferase family 4 protein [Bacteroidota bacterium]
MKVTLINTSDTIGGAAIAARRLVQALSESKVDVSLLVKEKNSDDKLVHSTTNSKFKKYLNFLRFVYERLLFYLREKNVSVRFAFSIGNTGENIVNHPLIKNTDIIHLHWINEGFLSLRSLKKIFKLNKPIVWTFHDMWAFTGGCHYAGNCEKFKEKCHYCPFLKYPQKKDLSYRVWNRKKKIYKNSKINVVTCSNWLKHVVKESTLLKGNNIISIQNPINTDFYKPADKYESKRNLGISTKKKLILFGAMNTNDKRKGSQYLIDSLKNISENNPVCIDKVALVIFGKNKTPFYTDFETFHLNFISNQEDIINIYNACDVFVTPSIEDNLPNTIVEAHACGLPVVAFNATGMPEMISHKKNGYLATYKSSEDFAAGIIWTLFESDYNSLSNDARKKAVEFYSPDISANKYIELYKSLLNIN